ncbi:hypothetical protein J6590_074533 [Homalodisca vitripennis]|nr:hypothetical protein J6590_074533 [Homalodisca vitripennis]
MSPLLLPKRKDHNSFMNTLISSSNTEGAPPTPHLSTLDLSISPCWVMFKFCVPAHKGAHYLRPEITISEAPSCTVEQDPFGKTRPDLLQLRGISRVKKVPSFCHGGALLVFRTNQRVPGRKRTALCWNDSSYFHGVAAPTSSFAETESGEERQNTEGRYMKAAQLVWILWVARTRVKSHLVISIPRYLVNNFKAKAVLITAYMTMELGQYKPLKILEEAVYRVAKLRLSGPAAFRGHCLEIE